MLQIQKRDGTLVLFDKQKIIEAVNKAFIDVDGKLYETDTAEDIARVIEDLLYFEDEHNNRALSVEMIQDAVEELLMESCRKDVARSYIRYRYKKEVARTYSNDFIDAFAGKLKAENVQNQNANVDEHSFGGRMGEATELMTKQYALDFCVSPMAKENHLNNEIYIHDLGSYAVGMHNCLTIPFDDLLAKGFNTRQTDVRPANSVNTAFQLVAVLFQLQSLQQFGGVAASHLDWTMVPYVRKSFGKHYKDGLKHISGIYPSDIDYQIEFMLNNIVDHSIAENEWEAYNHDAYRYAIEMTERETQQAVEGMYHNLNTLQSRSGNQLPFTSVNYGTCTLPEGRMVIKALLEGSIKGTGKLRKTSIFPCGIFQCMKGVNRVDGDPNYDLYQLALQSTATRLYPNYANVDWSGNIGYDRNDPSTYFATMGCRTANGYDINGLGQQKDGRGNICPVTIILPTLAMQAVELADNFSEDYQMNHPGLAEEIFFDRLQTKINEAKDMLIERFEYICNQDASAAKFMYENGTMAGYVPEEGIRSALKHGTLAVG